MLLPPLDLQLWRLLRLDVSLWAVGGWYLAAAIVLAQRASRAYFPINVFSSQSARSLYGGRIIDVALIRLW
jgi:hypothetical protein